MKAILLAVLLATVAMAQDHPKDYKLSEIQSLRLQVKQKEAIIAKNNLDQAQHNFQQALTDLTSEGDKIKSENGWPKETTFEPNTLQFSAPPAKEAKK